MRPSPPPATRALGTAALAIAILAACALPGFSPRPSASPAAALDGSPTLAPQPTAAAAGSPAPSPAAASPATGGGPYVPALQVPGVARITVDGLAVRTSPDTEASLVDGLDARGAVVTPNLFIGTGALVSVLSGPLEHQGIGWFRVAPLPGSSDTAWESGHPARPQQGWVAGGQDGTPYLEPADAGPQPTPSATPRATPAPVIALAEAGRGPWVSPRLELGGPPIVEWDVADPDGDGCRFGLFVSGAGGTQQAVSGSIARTDGSTWTARGLTAGGYTVRIDGDCAWAIIAGAPTGGG
jgi:hypothetical protein